MRHTNESDDLLIGRNAVTEALKSGRPIRRLLAARGSEGSIRRLTALARQRGVPVRFVSRSELDRLTGGVHQGVAAYTAAHAYSSVEEILARAQRAGEDPFLIVLDDLSDPRNLGAILRTAECAGAHGVIIGRRRSPGLTATVAKTSAGAVEYVPVACVANIARTLAELKQRGIWTAACDMDGERYDSVDLKGPIALVIGSEGAGLGRLVRETCDFAVSIPLCGRIESLNASNAAAVLMYEVRRQRDGR
ncbi:MAG: 23S rRNA (guanosine(2251)-2'-O)-methyltransferase RlmB [Anaerovoracaceae bacterium]